MMPYYQETDSKVIVDLPYEYSHTLPIEPINETIGGSLNIYFSPLVKSAWDTINQTEDQEVAKEARRLLSNIQETIASFQQFGFELGYLPPLRSINVDDGSVLIEWILSDFRIGFNVEPNPKDSGWYLVSNKNLGEISASGYTSSINIKTLVLWLLNFILSNF